MPGGSARFQRGRQLERGGQQAQRERDLTGDEDPAAAGLGTRASAPRGRGAERRGRMLTGGVKRGDEPESQSRQERGHECARHDRPVQRHGKHHERRDQLHTRPRQRQRDEGGTDGQDQAFDDQLADEPEPGRAERQTDRHLTAAPGGTHQEEVRGVDTGEREHEKGNGQDDGDHQGQFVHVRFSTGQTPRP